mmetsp:Transcript_19465/g.58279  ORF Transcript_19465/g.58279 Transcript_19465/m.58279 type:complete len:103 (-) Transcript_19465:187-495(-)
MSRSSSSLDPPEHPPFEWSDWAPMLMASRSVAKLYVWMTPEEFETWSVADPAALRQLVAYFQVSQEMVQEVEQAKEDVIEQSEPASTSCSGELTRFWSGPTI